MSIRRSPSAAVGREEPQPIGRAVGAELGEGLLERLAAQHRALRLVELAKTRVQTCCERVRLQQAEAEAVDGRDPRTVELAGEIGPSALRQRGPDARPQLARGAARVRDHEDRVDVDAAVAHGADEPLDEHRGLAGAGPCGDEHLARCGDGGLLLLVHARGTRHIGQRSHQAGHWSPFGSWSTSPARILSGQPARRGPRVLDGSPERLLVEVVVPRIARQRLALARAQQAARLPLAGERPVHASERLEADQVAQHEHVERDLQTQLALDLARRVRVLPRLVVLHDPARAERVDVDAVDLPGERQAVSQVEAALQLGRGALATERDLEAAGNEPQLACALLVHRRLEIAPQRLVELAGLHLGHLHPDALQRLVEAGAHEAHRTVLDAVVQLLDAELLGQPREELEERAVRDRAAQLRIHLRVDRLRVEEALEEPGRRAVREPLELGDVERRLRLRAARARADA